MSNFSAKDVMELRKRTNAGMMECKKALTESAGDMDKAAEYLRKAGQARADKKADRIAAEGLVSVKISADNKAAGMVEVNCETDFVAKQQDFINFVVQLADLVLANKITEVANLQTIQLKDKTIEESRKDLVAKLGENITIRRVKFASVTSGIIGSYLHGGQNVASIATIVAINNSNVDLGKDLAMHVTAMNPEAIDQSGLSSEKIAKEKDIYLAQSKDLHKGKPAEVLEKIVNGQINKFINDSTLLGQNFVKDPKKTIKQLLQEHKAEVILMQRFAVGEGIEKKKEDFATEVMSQVKN